MDSKVSYALIGLFVLILGVAFGTMVIWLGAGHTDKIYKTYVAYMYQSVSGLNVDAAVKYRGVDVGQVQDIALDPKNSERVRLLLEIEEGTPIKEDTVAILATQGITGLAFVELQGGSRESPLLKAKRGEEYPEIKTGPSLLVRMDTAVSELLAQLTAMSTNFRDVAREINRLLNDENQQAFNQTLQNIAKITDTMGTRIDTLAQGMDKFDRILGNTAQASQSLPELLQTAQEAVATINRTAGGFEQAMSGTQQEILRSTSDSMTQLSTLLTQLNELSISLGRIAEEFERNPNMILFGRDERQPGPGEQR